MANDTRLARPCAWHNNDGTPCASVTKLTSDVGIPVCMEHGLLMAFAIEQDLEEKAEEARLELERDRYEIADEALREHREEDGCDVLKYLAEIEAEQAESEARRGPNYIYYMTCGEYVKIGRSTTPLARLRTIRSTGGVRKPDGMDLAATNLYCLEVGPASLERERHYQFSHLRDVGEWFRCTPALQRWMDSLPGVEFYFPDSNLVHV